MADDETLKALILELAEALVHKYGPQILDLDAFESQLDAIGSIGSGESGASGASGALGFSGASGFSGVGTSGFSGFSGAGASGFSGDSGTSGFSGAEADSGVSGFSGTSGVSGFSGASGTSGSVGITGDSGFSGDVGTSGFSGTSGTVGASGISGSSGTVGDSGFSGHTGASGFSGQDGAAASSGISGFSGTSGASGFSGTSGTSGEVGASGTSGTVGTIGTSGFSGASGTSGFSGISGTSGAVGTSGTSGVGTSGFSGDSGVSGFSGQDGAAASSGISGFSGTSGASGFSGSSGSSGEVGEAGASGTSGAVGPSGFSGTSGTSGFSGTSGTSGAVGPSGTSGAGTSGFSGYSGFSGTSGNSGISGVDGAAGSAGTSGFSGVSGAAAVGGSGELYVASVASSGGDFTSLSAAIADYESSGQPKGIINVRGTVTAMAGAQSLTSPGLEIIGETDDAQLNFTTNDLTVATGVTNERVPLTLKHLTLNMTTSQILFSGSGYPLLVDVTVTGGQDEKFVFAGDDSFAVLERVIYNDSVGHLFGFDDSLVSGSFEAWFHSCLFLRGTPLVRSDTPAGGIDSVLHFVDRTLCPAVIMSATGQTVDIYMDSTSIYYSLSAAGTINIFGTGYFDAGMEDRYETVFTPQTMGIQEVIVSFIDGGGKDLVIGPGTYDSQIITIPNGNNNFRIRGSGKGATLLRRTSGTFFSLGTNTDVTIEDMSMESTATGASSTFITGTDCDRSIFRNMHMTANHTSFVGNDNWVSAGTGIECIIENITTTIASGGTMDRGALVGPGSYVHGCHFEGIRQSGVDSDLANTPGTRVVACSVECILGGARGIEVGGDGGLASGCRVEYITGAAGAGPGIALSFGTAGMVTGCHIDCNNIVSTGIQALNNDAASVSGNAIRDPRTRGINFAGTSKGSIVGNSITSALAISNAGIEVHDETIVANNNIEPGGTTTLAGINVDGLDCVISGNRIDSCSDGINVTATHGQATIIGNVITNSTAQGIEITGIGDNVVTGNMITGSGGQGILATSVDNSVYNANVVANNVGTDINVTGTNIVNTDNVTH